MTQPLLLRDLYHFTLEEDFLSGEDPQKAKQGILNVVVPPVTGRKPER